MTGTAVSTFLGSHKQALARIWARDVTAIRRLSFHSNCTWAVLQSQPYLHNSEIISHWVLITPELQLVWTFGGNIWGSNHTRVTIGVNICENKILWTFGLVALLRWHRRPKSWLGLAYEIPKRPSKLPCLSWYFHRNYVTKRSSRCAATNLSILRWVIYYRYSIGNGEL